ncbi:MAG: putative metal-binding motif-containing protein [bacterium]|nr:putative metal-binding motif-containing protein [bacterium]
MRKIILSLVLSCLAACGEEPTQKNIEQQDAAALRSVGAPGGTIANGGDATATATNGDVNVTVEVTNDVTVVVEGNTAEPDVPVACDDNVDCDDGNACNGPERCVAGACLPALYELTCDDGIGCTEDWCDPSVGCKVAVADGFCAETEYCEAWGVPGDVGCVEDWPDYRCDNSSDDDRNGLTDCADPACAEKDFCTARADLDGDGYPVSAGDCDDGNPAVHPDATEVCDGGVDNDCNPVSTESCTVTPDISVTCSPSDATPTAGIVIANTAGNAVLAGECRSDGASHRMRKVTFCNVGARLAAPFVTLEWNWNYDATPIERELQHEWLGADGCATFHGVSSFFVGDGTEEQFRVNVDTACIGPICPAESGDEVIMVFAGAEFENTDTAETVTVTDGWQSSTQVLRATRPSVSVTYDTPSGAHPAGLDDVLYVHVCNDGAQDLSIAQVAFGITTSAVSGSDWSACGISSVVHFYDRNVPWTNLASEAAFSCSTTNGHEGAVNMTIDPTQFIPGGMCANYGLRLNTTGATTGDQLQASMTNIVWSDGYADAIDGTGVPGLPAFGSKLRTP